MPGTAEQQGSDTRDRSGARGGSLPMTPARNPEEGTMAKLTMHERVHFDEA